MRTPEQIKNLREVLSSTIGINNLSWSDEEVDAWAESIQAEINTPKYHWNIQIRFRDNGDAHWSEIKPEPCSIYLSLAEMKVRCNKLLQGHNIVTAMRISDRFDPRIVFLFEKEKLASET